MKLLGSRRTNIRLLLELREEPESGTAHRGSEANPRRIGKTDMNNETKLSVAKSYRISARRRRFQCRA